MTTRSGCARRTSFPSWCSTSTSRARRPGCWPASVSAPSCNDPLPHPRGPCEAGQAGDGQGGGSGEAGVCHRAHRQGHHRAARSGARRSVRQRDAAQPGRERGGTRAEAAHRTALGQVAPQGRGEGDPRVRSRSHPPERRQPHPHPAAAPHRGAAPRAGEGGAQVRRRGPRGRAARAYRGDQSHQEGRARLGRREKAHREGRPEAPRRAPQARGRSGQDEGSGDHGGLAMADDLLAQIRGNGVVPRHVAVIMDGNERWARERSLPRPLGHRAGMKAVREVIEGAIAAGVEVLTLFAFSAENWQRPPTEISALMELLEEYIAREVAELRDQGVAVHVLGDRTRLAPGARDAVERVERETRDGAKLALNLCISYSSRAELARAARLLAEEVLKGAKRLEDIDEDAIRAKLYTAPWSDPDLLIRTSGECRLSNFLLWQLAYTELYITPVLWPDVTRRDLFQAILDYQGRDRRFGRITA